MFTLLAQGDGGGIAATALGLLVTLASAALVGTLFGRLRMETIPAFLVAGAAVGPHALRLVSPEAVDAIAPLAMVLLMFSIGLQLDMTSMRRGVSAILLVGVLTTVAVALCVAGVCLAYGLGGPASVLIGIGMAMSSTAILVRIVMKRRELRTSYARLGLGISIVQDLASVLAIAAIPALAAWAGVGGAESSSAPRGALQLVTEAAIAVGGVAGMLVLGRLLLPRLLATVVKVGSGELLIVSVGAIALAAAIGTALLGFSAEMGAFLAGFMLSLTPYRYQLSGQLAPIRDLLMAVFFTAVGLQLDPSLMAREWWVILLSALLVLSVKSAVIGFAGWALGMSASSALLLGVYLGNAGEFTLVVLAAGASAGVVTPEVVNVSVAVVIVTLIVSPLLASPAHRLALALAPRGPAPWARRGLLSEQRDRAAVLNEPAEARAEHRVVIAGFGPVGRSIADRLAVLNVPCTIIELNPRTVQKQAAIGRDVVYGDVTNPEVLERADVREADAVVLTMPDEEATLRAVQLVRQLAPGALIAARTNFLSGSFVAHSLGADVVAVEEVATALVMERDVMRALERRWGKAKDVPAPMPPSPVPPTSSGA